MSAGGVDVVGTGVAQDVAAEVVAEVPEATMTPGEIGEAGALAVRELCAKHVASLPMADYVLRDPMPWRVLSDGGWDLLGVPEDADGAGADARDLVEVAIAWGWSIVPLPLVPTLLAKRWVPAAREHDGPVTFAVPSPATPGRSAVPFATAPGVALLTGTGADASLVTPEALDVDDYAPSLRLATTPASTDWTADAVAEALAMWAGEAAGYAQRTLSDAVAYAKERTQFGQPIGRFQAVKHHLANAHIMAERAETAAIWAAVQPDRAQAASTAAFDAAVGCIEIAIQVHGGLGFTWEMGVHFPLRHVVALRDLASGLVGP